MRNAKDLESYGKIEDFYNYRNNKIPEDLELSHCNAIIPMKYKFSRDIENSEELYKAYYKVKKSLILFNELVNKYAKTSTRQGEIQISNNIKLHGNYQLSFFSFGIFNDSKEEVVFKKGYSSKYLNTEMDFLNKLSLKHDLCQKLFEVVTKSQELDRNEELFNFKDIWIAWEAIFPKTKFIEIAQLCMSIKLKRNFFSSMKLFISNLVDTHGMNISKEYLYFMTSEEMKKVGLELKAYTPITTKKFKRNYQKINDYISNPYMNEVLTRIDYFLLQENNFFIELNEWVENLINDVYIERNMEVHSNLKNDFSRIKLKNDFTVVSKTMYRMMIYFIDLRSPNNLELVIKK